MVLGPLGTAFTDLILMDQDCFRTDESWKELLKLLPDSTLVEKLQDKLKQYPGRSSGDRGI